MTMEKGKISASQFFALAVLFELNGALIRSPGADAKQDAWLAVLFGMGGGLLLFYLYVLLYRYYPDRPLTAQLEQILGRFLGRALALIYSFYFLYIAARVLRDFGDLLLIFIFPETPLSMVNLLMLLLVAYACYLGIETLARTGEIFFLVMFILGLLGNFFVLASNVFRFEHLQPVLEEGLAQVLAVAFPKTLTFPFGEMIVFTMLFPYLNKPKHALKTGMFAISVAGSILSWTNALNVGVLGSSLVANTNFPLLHTIGKVNIGDFIQRLDPIVVATLIIGVFFKIALCFYAAVAGCADLLRLQRHHKLIVPFAVAMFILSMTMAGNFVEQDQEIEREPPFFLHLPLQVGVPFLLLAVSWWQNRRKSVKGRKRRQEV
ncbi:spore germination protein GerKB [Bacillaceae bacterium]